jgi:hypothetical protein
MRLVDLLSYGNSFGKSFALEIKVASMTNAQAKQLWNAIKNSCQCRQQLPAGQHQVVLVHRQERGRLREDNGAESVRGDRGGRAAIPALARRRHWLRDLVPSIRKRITVERKSARLGPLRVVRDVFQGRVVDCLRFRHDNHDLVCRGSLANVSKALP